MHEKEKTQFQCDLCGLKTAFRRSLKLHLKNTHKIDPESGNPTDALTIAANSTPDSHSTTTTGLSMPGSVAMVTAAAHLHHNNNNNGVSNGPNNNNSSSLHSYGNESSSIPGPSNVEVPGGYNLVPGFNGAMPGPYNVVPWHSYAVSGFGNVVPGSIYETPGSAYEVPRSTHLGHRTTSTFNK